MKIGIIGAMQLEMDNLLKSMKDATTVEYSGVTFYQGHIDGASDVEIVGAICGIGKVFAALCAQTMILKFNVDMVINIGVGGSVSKDLKVFDVVVADKVCQHDMNTTAIGDEPGLISGINKVYLEADSKMVSLIDKCLEQENVHYLTGTIATGDLFVATPSQRQHINEKFGALAADMESCAIGQVCYINKVPFTIIRSISDADGAVDYLTFAGKAAEVAIKVVVDFVKRVNEL